MTTRICMVVQKDYLIDGRVRRYAESLADSGEQVDILCVQNGKPDSAADYRDDIRIYRIPIGHGSKSRIGYMIEYLLAVFFFSIWLLRLHLKHRYDVIHIHNIPDFLIFTGLVPRLLGAKLILDIHDPMPEFYLSKFDHAKEGWPVKLLKLQECISAGFANAIITANDNFKRNLIARGIPAGKITVIDNIADTQIFNRSLHPRSSAHQATAAAEGRFTLLYPGTLAPRYGLDLPIRAAVQLRQKIPNLLVRIVGKHNKYADELKQLARDLGIERHVEILPGVPVHEVPGLMAAADLGIYTAYPDPHMSIATPTKVLEYMQMGLPVVAPKLLILEQLFDERSVRFFTPSSVDEFADAVLELWASPEMRQSLTEFADQNFIRNHTWQHEQAKYFQLLNQLLGTSIALPTSSQPVPEEVLV